MHATEIKEVRKLIDACVALRPRYIELMRYRQERAGKAWAQDFPLALQKLDEALKDLKYGL